MNAKTNFKRVWMITGAARGIGARITEAALARGEAVVATSRDAASLQKRFPESDALLALPLDVTDEAQAAAAVQSALARFGRIDVLVNNAGYGLLGAVEEATADEVRRLYDTNVFGLLNVTRAVLPAMRARRSGHVINISSLGGYQSGPGFGVYCSTKFAVEGLSEALHGELAPLGIHVTVVEPGYFRTDFLDSNSLAVSPRILDDYAASAFGGKSVEAASARQSFSSFSTNACLSAIVCSVSVPSGRRSGGAFASTSASMACASRSGSPAWLWLMRVAAARTWPALAA